VRPEDTAAPEHECSCQLQTSLRGNGSLAANLRFSTAGFPGDWHIVVERIVGGDQDAASDIQFTGADGSQAG
jgi:hypothetical protein